VILLATLLALTVLRLSQRDTSTHTRILRHLRSSRPPAGDQPAALSGLFLLLLDLRLAWVGLAIVVTTFTIAFREVLKQVDWALIVVFILMFINLRLLADLPPVQATVSA
jgi:di/tricarboxylate transporter